nr:immunoglobulin light chain junction region [Macaca mulatta]MOY16059.1 immunoglobulin light chain junction region [Macaca mulatta]MOY16629.1 immunoglobulin light chain junction region [Macaca mulatta]MOY16892.1 immunoglobulin light chain junction region [Macaca mulatta]MOY17077.1 immunoglobulin light chain junction region [Macaca mulatta]
DYYCCSYVSGSTYIF